MIASHYIIEEILNSWDEKDKLKENLEKFSKRYPEDKELHEIYKEFMELSKKEEKDKDKENLKKIKVKLEKLKERRAIITHGGSDNLPYSDRRHFSDEYARS